MKRMPAFLRHLLLLLMLTSLLSAGQQASYPYNPDVSQEVWQQLEPYFLPYDHPVKKKLDRLFSKKRATATLESFRKAGFLNAKFREPTNIVVGLNSELKGFVIKAYLDSQPPLCEWENWLKRIRGAERVRNCIQAHHFKDCLVPHKWIYPLPREPKGAKSAARKHFILVVEEMPILKAQDNLKAFNQKMTKRLLTQLYTVIQECGLIDSVYPDNIPFTREGQIAFIDTEHSGLSPIPFHVLSSFLSPNMQTTLQNLINTGYTAGR